MAITNFIPAVWSETLYQKLNQKYVAVSNCNREWEGDIKKAGDRVKILGLNPISIFDYKKNTNLDAPATLNDNVRELVIDQAKAFNFLIDDVDRAQTTPKLMNLALNNAASSLATSVDRYILGLCHSVDETRKRTLNYADDANILDFLRDSIIELMDKGVTEDMILEVSPRVAALITKAKIGIATDNTDALENGCIGSFAGCKIFVSNNVYNYEGDETVFYTCVLRSKRAVAFAEQLSEIEAYRPELRFADAVKGLMLFGAKIVYPEEYLALDIEIECL